VRLNVAGDPNSAARIWADFADLPTLQPDDDALDLGALGLLHLLLVHYEGVCTRAAAEDTSSVGLGANVENLRTERDHVDGEAVASCCRLCSQHTRIDAASHAGNQVLGNPAPVALDLVAGPHAIRSNDVRLFSSRYSGDEGQVGTAVWIVLYPFHDVLAGQIALIIDNSYPSLVPATSVSHRDSSGVVSSSQMLSLACKGELEKWSSFPQMVVHGPLEMSQTGRAGLVGAQRNKSILARALALYDAPIDSGRGLDRRWGDLVNGLGICAGRQQGPPKARGLEMTYPGLQHGRLMWPAASSTSRRSNGSLPDGVWLRNLCHE
jgi:hypothetical protein